MDFDPDGTRLPIKVDSASNGEYAPRPLSPAERAANAHARKRVGEAARRAGLTRRAFLKTCAGSAATLLAFNEVHGRQGPPGGFFDVPVRAAYDLELAEAALGGDEFIFDIQTHCVDPSGKWLQGADGRRWEYVLNQAFAQRRKCREGGYDCYSAEQLVKEVFLDTDTDVAFIPPPWVHRHRYHGVLAPSAPWRAQVTAMAADTAAQVPLEVTGGLPALRLTARTQDGAAETLHRSYATSLWAMLLARTYEVFPLVCPHGGAPVRIIAFAPDTASVTRILQHHGEPSQPPPVSPARGPPESAVPFDQSPAVDPEATEPAPAFEFDQTVVW